MNKRKQFIDYVSTGGQAFCSPQIGGGAGFDTKLTGKEWITETSLEDTLAAVERFDMVPLINVGLCDLGDGNPDLRWDETVEVKGNRVERDYQLKTPQGTLHRKTVEEKFAPPIMVKYPVEGEPDLKTLEYYLERALEGDFSIVADFTRDISRRVGDAGALCIQWAVQPYELLCFPNTVNTVMLAHDCPSLFRKLMEQIVLLDEKLLRAVAEGGADFIFLGGPGVEMISPKYYEDFIIPYSQRVTAMAHGCGLKVYSHICSPIEPFLTMGFYNRMGIDLFETLSPPPVGNISSLTDALEKIDPAICTRGNLGLDVLLNSTPEIVRQKTLEIMEATRNRKHIVAASDYLFYQIPEENVRAMVDAVRGIDLTCL
ncbi:MAG: uroporphyrinogen decarboxylase family protein [Phycisphaerae bacterium]